MKTILSMFTLFCAIFSVSSFAEEKSPSCEEKYTQSKLPGAQLAYTFLVEAYGDCDYESVNQMALFVRKDRKLPAWDKEGFEDPINCVLMRLVQAKIEQYCEAPMSLKTLQRRISRIDLPRFIDENEDLRHWIPDWR